MKNRKYIQYSLFSILLSDKKSLAASSCLFIQSFPNDMIRFFYPKGFDFRTVTEADIASVEALLNNRPRKCLDWKTPFEVFWEKSVALD